MVKRWIRGVFSLVGRIFSRLQTPRYMIVELEKGVLLAGAGDEEAVASLKNHPGYLALLNRMRLKRAFLEAQLRNVKHESIRDVDSLQLALYWVGFIESEVNAATKNLGAKVAPRLAVDETQEFEKIRSAIESVGTTIPSRESA